MKFKISIGDWNKSTVYYKTLREVESGFCEIGLFNQVIKELVYSLMKMRATEKMGNGYSIDTVSIIKHNIGFQVQIT